MKKVLLVEDDASGRQLLGDVLRHAGHEVRSVETADEGLTLLATETFDLIVMDIQLPGMDGLTAARMLRSSPSTENLKVLAVTAHAMRGDEARILSQGCDGYVAKPIAYKEFLAEVRRLLTSGAEPEPKR